MYYGASCHGVRALPAYLLGNAGEHSCNDRFAAHHNTTSDAIVGWDTTFLGEQGPDRNNFTVQWKRCLSLIGRPWALDCTSRNDRLNFAFVSELGPVAHTGVAPWPSEMASGTHRDLRWSRGFVRGGSSGNFMPEQLESLPNVKRLDRKCDRVAKSRPTR